MEGRRHSLDIPISKTLVALRRVRSLRDPSTNSMSKFSALIDDLNWDTDSHNGISLRFETGGEEGARGKDSLVGCERLGTFREEETVQDFELYDGHGTIRSNSELAPGPTNDNGRVAKLEYKRDIAENILHRKKNAGEVEDDGLELACVLPSGYHMEGEDSSHEINSVSPSLAWENHALPAQKRPYVNHTRSPRSVGDVISSRVSSPYPCHTNSVLGGSTPATSLFADEEGDDFMDRDYRGCTVSCCWSRTPRFRSPTVLSDEEDCALLSGEIGGTNMPEQTRIWKNVNSEITPYSGSSTSLSQKFQPRSFRELVGHGLIARSLLGAISKGRITSLYIFHGPRGTGKTCASRIFAAALNCLALEDQKPCGMCQECVLYFTGRSRDVKEVDSVRISHANGVRFLVKNAALPPVSSRYKVIIVDECQLLKDETWVTLLHSMHNFSQHVVFVMITPDLDKLPKSAVARSKKYHFPKILDADIANRLAKICVQEGLEFDHAALDFIAAKSNGSLRDAEMMLDQLSLLGKRITVSMAYELIGSASDDELLDLLDLALSADTINTVRRARELMRSKIDPMQLISQLANIIMDILAGKCQAENSMTQRNFLKHASMLIWFNHLVYSPCIVCFTCSILIHGSVLGTTSEFQYRYCSFWFTAEMDLQKLQHALKILSDCEKQLRTSKNQTTWLTVALLQLNSGDFSANETRIPLRSPNLEDDSCSKSSQDERSKYLATCECDDGKWQKMGVEEYVGTLESIWMRATETCQSNSLRNLLRKRGKLSSVSVEKGIAVAELEFSRPKYASKAEKSWKDIASSLQSVLGCNVEIRINLSPNASLTGFAKARRLSSKFFSCSCRMHHSSNSLTENGSNDSGISNFTSNKAVTGDKTIDTCSSSGSGCLSQFSHKGGNHNSEVVSTIRNSDGNALSTGATTPHRSSGYCAVSDAACLGAADQCREDENISRCKVLTIQEPEIQPDCYCFCKTMRLHRKLLSLNSSNTKMVHLKFQQQDCNSNAANAPRDAFLNSYICSDYPEISCSGPAINNAISEHHDGPVDDAETKLCCWETPRLSFKKVTRSSDLFDNHQGTQTWV
ncbi:hypothetical protein Dimus_023742 [Dionaea muscipula]